MKEERKKELKTEPFSNDEKGLEKETTGQKDSRLKELEAELKKLLEREEERKADYEKRVKNYEMQAGEQAIMKEAEETAAVYKNFDFEQELENPVFVRLLKNEFDVKSAYEASHLDEIKEEFIKTAKADGVKKRPYENGTGKGGGALLKSGVYALTKKEREELAKRTQRGETIRF